MKRQRITRVLRTKVENEKGEYRTVQRCIDGRIIETRTPVFEGPTYDVPAGLQPREECRYARELHNASGVIDDGPIEMHHDLNTGKMQAVQKDPHEQLVHISGSAFRNDEWCKDKIKKAGNWEISRAEQVRNKINYETHKHPIAAGTIAAGASGIAYCAIYKGACKMFGLKPSKTGYAVCATLGIATGVVTGIMLHDDIKRY